jgi:hypothetical protein
MITQIGNRCPKLLVICIFVIFTFLLNIKVESKNFQYLTSIDHHLLHSPLKKLNENGIFIALFSSCSLQPNKFIGATYDLKEKAEKGFYID